MASLEEPTRWSDAGELPDALLRDLSTYRDHGPSEVQVTRMLEALAEPVHGGAVGAQGGTKLGLWKWGSAIVAVALLGLMTWNVLRDAPTESPAATHSEIPVQAAPEAPPIAAPSPDAPAMATAPTTAEETVSPPPAPQRVRVQASSKPKSDPAAELTILTRARRLLVTAPAQSLALTEEHRTQYPKGAFAEERELLAVEALVKLARPADAQTRGRAFLRAHPGSAHAERVRILVEPSP